MLKQQVTMSKQRSTLLPKTATVSNEFIVKFRLFDKVETNWTCSICFDFVERTKLRLTFDAKNGNIVVKNGNNVEATCDFVERKNCLTCSVRQFRLDIVAGVDEAWELCPRCWLEKSLEQRAAYSLLQQNFESRRWENAAWAYSVRGPEQSSSI